MNDLRRRVDPDGKPIAHPVGHHRLAAAPLIKPGPVAEHGRAKTVPAVKHQLPAMRMAGERQRQIQLNRRVEGMRMMRQQNREGIRLALLREVQRLLGSIVDLSRLPG